MREYYAKMLPKMLLSRERLLAAVKGAPPGPIPYLPRLPPKPSLRPGHRSIYQRAKQRYFDELNAVRSEVGGDSSDDENYPEGPDEPFKDRKPASQCPLEPVSIFIIVHRATCTMIITYILVVSPTAFNSNQGSSQIKFDVQRVETLLYWLLHLIKI